MNNYQPGAGGVNIVKNPLQLADNELVEAKNAEFHPDSSIGGEAALTKRGGFTRLFTDALAGAIHGMSGLGLDAIPVSIWVPSADISESKTGDTPTTVSVVGGPSDNWEAVEDNDDSTYVRVNYAASSSGASVFIMMRLKDIPDPGHDNGFTLKFRARRSDVDTGNINDASMAVLVHGENSTINGKALVTGDLTDEFQEFSMALSEADIQALRADNGFALGRVQIFTRVLVTSGSLTETFDFDISRIWIVIDPEG